MKPLFTLLDAEFKQAVRESLIESSRELSKAVNARMFFLSLKALRAMRPIDRKAQQKVVRAYLYQRPSRIVIAIPKKPTSRKRKRLTLAHLIVQKKQKLAGKPGLYGTEMAEAARKFIKAKAGRVGFLKSVWAGINKRFNRYARGPKISERKHKAITERHVPAVPGINPTAIVNSGIPIKADQISKVQREFQNALGIAMASELVEMRQHALDKMKKITDAHNGR